MKKKLVIVGIVLAILGGGVFAYTQLHDEQTNQSTDSTNSSSNQQSVTNDKQLNDSNTPDSSTTKNQATTDKQSASVSVSEASYDKSMGMVHVRAFADVLEDGSCQLTFTKAGQQDHSYTGNTEIQASYTQCNPFDIPHTEFPVHGTWQFTLVFESPHYRGEAKGEVTL